MISKSYTNTFGILKIAILLEVTSCLQYTLLLTNAKIVESMAHLKTNEIQVIKRC